MVEDLLSHECILSCCLKVKLSSLRRNKSVKQCKRMPPDTRLNEFNQPSNCDFNNPPPLSPPPPPRLFPLSFFLSHHRRGPEYKLCFPFFIWVAYNAVGHGRTGDGSECVPANKKREATMGPLHRQKDGKTKRCGNRDTSTGREYVEMNGRYGKREKRHRDSM